MMSFFLLALALNTDFTQKANWLFVWQRHKSHLWHSGINFIKLKCKTDYQIVDIGTACPCSDEITQRGEVRIRIISRQMGWGSQPKHSRPLSRFACRHSSCRISWTIFAVGCERDQHHIFQARQHIHGGKRKILISPPFPIALQSDSCFT